MRATTGSRATSRTLTDSTLDRYRAGVAALADVTADWDDAQWAQPACGDWAGTDLAGHLVIVAGWYHEWLDRARAGDSSPPLPAKALAGQTEAAGDDHALTRADALAAGAIACVAASGGRVRGAVISQVASRLARRDPWGFLLQRSGRTP